MGLFKNVIGGATTFPGTEAEAVLGILLAVIAADGDISDDESASFMYLANNTKALGPMPANTFKDHVNTCLSMLRRSGPMQLMEACSPHVTAEKRKALFINACDLIMKDGRVEQEEEKLVEELQRRLSVDDAFAQQVVQLILVKYSL